MSHIRIELPGPTARHPETKIWLNGEEITAALERIQVDASSRELTTVTLHLAIPTAVINGQVDAPPTVSNVQIGVTDDGKPITQPQLSKPMRMDPETGAVCWCPSLEEQP